MKPAVQLADTLLAARPFVTPDPITPARHAAAAAGGSPATKRVRPPLRPRE
jgi:hypothetical protein